uniref:Secreted protein n=1 Tax=Glossina palpalis gambiensis TaxID=67801 RepID=A0A1B0AVL8_9MUSC
MLISCRQWHRAAMLRIIKFLFGGRALQWQSGAISITAASEAGHAHISATAGARSGGDVVLSVPIEFVSLRGVKASWGTPESARRMQRGVELEAILKRKIAVWLVIVIEDIICGGGGGSSSNSLKCNTFTPPTGGVCVFVIAPMPPLFATPLPLPTAMPTTVAAVADLNVAYSPSSISPVALVLLLSNNTIPYTVRSVLVLPPTPPTMFDFCSKLPPPPPAMVEPLLTAVAAFRLPPCCALLVIKS